MSFLDIENLVLASTANVLLTLAYSWGNPIPFEKICKIIINCVIIELTELLCHMEDL